MMTGFNSCYFSQKCLKIKIKVICTSLIYVQSEFKTTTFYDNLDICRRGYPYNKGILLAAYRPPYIPSFNNRIFFFWKTLFKIPGI